MSRLLLSKKVRLILRHLLAVNPAHPAWGLSICRGTGLGSGSVYVILERLRRAGWVESRTETATPEGRPPRTFYKLTDRGAARARSVLENTRE
ncbi:PadR family transcriptional regulator [Streptomyces sp. NPDC048389]|uniref:PadR family transcriptional regulator n=1 Tax=Streptomyces sp. NPDC048389 TaxID=3154622 RepID=UPI00345131CF